MKKNVVIIIIVILVIVLTSIYLSNKGQVIDISNSEFESKILVENLDTPWAIDFLSNGDMVFTERYGRVSIFNFDSEETKVIGDIAVSEKSEAGLLGIAVDPNYANNRFVYIYYTSNNRNQVSRFELINDELMNEVILLDNIPNARFHDGGRIKFGPDEKLYITTGDAIDPSTAQDIDSLAGKILRMNKDGSAPEDNPFGNYVYSYGHRNPQGIAWNSNGELFSSEHGPTRNDEINLIVKGNNYGWPFECVDDLDFGEDITNPIRCFTEFTLAPSGIAFYNGDLYVASLKGTQLRRIIFNEDYRTIIDEEELFDELGRIREVVEHEGYIYIATSNKDGRGFPRQGDDKIIRMKLT